MNILQETDFDSCLSLDYLRRGKTYIVNLETKYYVLYKDFYLTFDENKDYDYIVIKGRYINDFYCFAVQKNVRKFFDAMYYDDILNIIKSDPQSYYHLKHLQSMIRNSEFIKTLDEEFPEQCIELERKLIFNYKNNVNSTNVINVMESIRFFGIDCEDIQYKIFKCIYEESLSNDGMLNEKLDNDKIKQYIKLSTPYEGYIKEFPIVEAIGSALFLNKSGEDAVINGYKYFLMYLFKNGLLKYRISSFAARHGQLECLKYLHKAFGGIRGALSAANKACKIKCVEYVYENTNQNTNLFLEEAVFYHHMDGVKFALEKKLPQYISKLNLLTTIAVFNDDYEIFKLLLENKSITDKQTMAECIRKDFKYVKLLTKYDDKEYNLEYELIKNLIARRELDNIKYVCRNGYIPPSDLLLIFYIEFNYDGVNFLLSIGVSYTERIVKYVADYNDIKTLQLFKDDGFVFSISFINTLSNTITKDKTLLFFKDILNNDPDIILSLLERNDIRIIDRYIKLGFNYDIDKILLHCAHTNSLNRFLKNIIALLEVDIDEYSKTTKLSKTDYNFIVSTFNYDLDNFEIEEPDYSSDELPDLDLFNEDEMDFI